MEDEDFKIKTVNFRNKIAEINSVIDEQMNNPQKDINYARKLNLLKEELAEIAKDMYKNTKFK